MSENKTNNLNNTCARYEFISFENTQRITDPSKASNKFFFCRKTSNFNGSCNVTLHLWCDNNIYINGVCSYVCRWKNYRWQHLNLIGSRQFSPLFPKGGHLRTPTQVSEDLKTPIKKLSNIILQACGDSGCELGFKSNFLQALYLGNSKVG